MICIHIIFHLKSFHIPLVSQYNAHNHFNSSLLLHHIAVPYNLPHHSLIWHFNFQFSFLLKQIRKKLWGYFLCIFVDARKPTLGSVSQVLLFLKIETDFSLYEIRFLSRKIHYHIKVKRRWMASEKSYRSRKSGIGSMYLVFFLISLSTALSLLQVVSQSIYFAHLLGWILKCVFAIVETFRAGFGKFVQ